MKTPGIHLYYQYNLSKDGKIYKKSRRRVAHSFVTAFGAIIFDLFARSYPSEEDTGGTSRGIAFDLNAAATAGNTTYGIVVGTGTNVVAITDNKLQTLITHGATSGKLQYSACTVALPTFVSGVSELIITRLFTNASGGTIAIKEIGIYVVGSYYFCIARDLTSITSTDGSTLTINYIIQTTV